LARSLALGPLALAASVRGRFEDAAKLIAESAREVETIGTREAYDSCPHMILGLQLMRVDRLDEAYAAVQRGRQASEALGMVDTLASFHYELALVDVLRGRIDDALAELQTHRQYSQQTGAGWSVPADSLRALIALHRGDVLAADGHVSVAEHAAADGAPKHRTDLMVLAWARVLESSGESPAAIEILANAFQTAQSTGAVTNHPVIVPELARLAALTVRIDRAASSPSDSQIPRLPIGCSSHGAPSRRMSLTRSPSWRSPLGASSPRRPPGGLVGASGSRALPRMWSSPSHPAKRQPAPPSTVTTPDGADAA
jgi:ATP/maltotriose-dependent transcriptional regulator MalT